MGGYDGIMPRLLLGIAVIVVVVTIYAVVDCAMMASSRVRGLPKAAWIAIIILLPVIGLVLWFLIGRGRKNPTVASGPRAPDDDPAFLVSLNRDAEQDERIRKLEEELAALDSESPDDGGPGAGHPDTLPDDPADHGADRQDGDSRDR
ncbi:phospholipase D-like protein [Labedella gwakjiensis]|uniref:Phospholipase D-like protein n=2 Tax=Labedella gwakjiensis TaxID=390269 RepID=A0A2P8GSW8_9MICO|nr:phospholipase D-like protein [Labedella gwakjiensis]